MDKKEENVSFIIKKLFFSVGGRGLFRLGGKCSELNVRKIGLGIEIR